MPYSLAVIAAYINLAWQKNFIICVGNIVSLINYLDNLHL